MYKKISLIAVLAIIFGAASIKYSPKKSKEIILKAMSDQQECWNNTDLECFMSYYHHSDSIQFVAKNGVNYGWDNIYKSYQIGFPNAEAMGKLTYTIIDVELYGKKHAMVTGKFELERKNDKPSGYFTLIWEKIDGKWLIISDHTST